MEERHPKNSRQKAYKLLILRRLDQHLAKTPYLNKKSYVRVAFLKRMARSIVPVICLLIVVMDVVAGILGIEAQIAQNKESYITVSVFECRQPSYQAYRDGVAALILLALAHAIANALGGCVCVFSRDDFQRSSPNKQRAAGSLIFSWLPTYIYLALLNNITLLICFGLCCLFCRIVLIIAFSLLIIGTVTNSRPRGTCGLSHQHVLVVGGILCFVHGLFLVPYYVSANAVSVDEMRLPA
ncbi:LOW QUALITY PROTEIN: hypothetical protein V2J09_020969 [Rumex salicifolius]